METLGIKDPEYGRQLVRTRMKKLAEEGKVNVSEAPKGSRAEKVYGLGEC